MAEVREVAMTRAPIAFASWIEAMPVLLLAAVVRRVCPSRSSPTSTSPKYTVRNCTPHVVACAALIRSGYGATACAGTIATSPYTPYSATENDGTVLTRSPTFTVSTPSPIASTTPAAS